MTPGAMTQMINGILAREGSAFTDDPDDRGGATKFGITQETLAHWRKAEVSQEDVEDLTADEAMQIYRQLYITDPRFDLINDDGIASLMVDWGVMSGPAIAIAELQQLLNAYGSNLTVDGRLGSATANAVNAFSAGFRTLRNLLVEAKVMYHVDDVVNHPAQIKFLRGWISRTFSFRSN